MERIICQCCGEALRKRGDVYVCGYCGATYRDDQAEGAADLLKGLLDDFKLEQLSNARRRLYETTHEKYPSSQAVTQAAGNVLSISPDDFMARMYLHSHDSDPHELISLLARSEVSEWEAKETVDWLTRSLDMRTLAAVKDFADRHLKGTEKTEALNRIEDEAFKLDSGVYDLSLKRDVFLCYSTEDMPRVIEIMETFEENALSCFAAFRNLRHGKGAQENYQEAIFRAMKNCRVFVFLSSNSSRDPNRKGVAEELEHLISDLPKKPRVEFLLEDYPERMPILAKRRMAEAFPHLEYCREPDDLIVRVSGLLDAEENAERERARKIAEEASERAKKELQAEFEAREAARKEEQAREREQQAKRQRELEEERLRLEKEKLEIEKRKIEAQKESSGFPPVGGAMDAESMLAMMEKAEELKRRRAEEAADRKKAEPTVDAINAIGKVEPTPECRGRIATARAYYSRLTEGQRAQVHNADILLAAEREYGEAEEAAAAERAIKAIGTVECSTQCKSRIDKAQSLYDALPEKEKALVPNHATLVSARAEYEKLKAEKEERERIKKEEDEAAKPIEAIFDMEILPDGNASVARCRDKEITEAAMPERYRGKAVTSIGNGAFKDCTYLKLITIPSSVTSIGNGAFKDCTCLKSITIPEGVTSIGGHAFHHCSSLTSIVIPNSVTSIAKGAFGFCHDLNSIAIPMSVTSIGEDAFYGCKSLTSIVIPNGVTSIGKWTFYNCSSLTSITIPSSVASIGEEAFYNCSSLTSIVIPESVTKIGTSAFEGCSSLTSIAIPEGVTSIAGRAFSGCSSLTSIAIPEGVTTIHYGAFSGCPSLTSITIPSSVTRIGEKAFRDCSSLKSITIPSSVTSIGDSAFSGCTCEIHFAQKKPLFGYPKGFPEDCLNGFKGKVFWGGK